MVEALFDKVAPWLAGDGPEAAWAVCCQCSLLRNLSDFPFPPTCSEDEKRSVEERVLGVLDNQNLLATGQYCSMANLTRREAHVLAERRLIPFEVARSKAHGGAYISDDQCAGIAVNGSDHLCLTMLGSGLQLQEVWTRLNLLDDDLAGALDYAFDERFGYLTTSLAHVGTGLKASVILHLPALAMSNALSGLVQMTRQRRQAIHGLKPTLFVPAASTPPAPRANAPISEDRAARTSEAGEAFYMDLTGALYGDVNEAQGDLHILTNLSTLGTSEQEILFHLRHTATDIIAQEKAAREALVSKERRRIEDRVARALGIARNARLLGFTEAVSLLSSLRLGLDTRLLSGFSLSHLNELLLASQSAHLKAKTGRDCDEWTLSVERADLFRARFAPE